MLYHMFEWQRRAFEPMRVLIDQSQHFFRNPMNPMSYTQGGRMIAAACDVIEHSTRRHGKPGFELPTTRIDGRDVAVTEEVVLKKPFGQLRHFVRDTRRQHPKLLIVAPMSGHFATLLRGTVEALLPDHDIYITDWRDAKAVPVTEGRFDLAGYIDYVIEFLEFLGPGAHVMAVCQPSVPVFAAVAHMAAAGHDCQPRSMTLMGGPIDSRANPTEVNRFAMSRPLSWFRQHVISSVPLPNAGFMRRVYPGFLQLAGFMAMNLGNHMVRHHDMFRHLVEGDGESADATRAFYGEYRSVMDLTEEFYLETVDVVFQRHLLPKGEFVYRDALIRPETIERTALFTIEGERDDISGVGQTKAAHILASSLPEAMKQHHEQEAVGHYGIFHGRKWREEIAPMVTKFIRTHD